MSRNTLLPDAYATLGSKPVSDGSRIVHVVHPIPARVVPPGLRTERLAFGKGTTAARLRRISAKLIPPVLNVFAGTPHARTLHSFDGSLWLRLETQCDDPRRQGRGIAPSEFVDWLQSPSEGWLHPSDFGRRFLGTPIYAVTGSEALMRGRERVLEESRIIHCDPIRSSADVAAFVERDLAVTRDAAFLRLDGPIVYTATYMPTLELGLSARDGDACVARVGDADAYRAMSNIIAFPHHALDDIAIGLGRPVAEFPGHLVGDVVETRFANAAPAEIVASCGDVLRRKGFRDQAARERLSGAMGRLAHWRMLGATGSVRPDEREAVARDCRETLDILFEASPTLAYVTTLSRISRFLDACILPALRAAEAGPDLDDAKALEGLVP